MRFLVHNGSEYMRSERDGIYMLHEKLQVLLASGSRHDRL